VWYRLLCLNQEYAHAQHAFRAGRRTRPPHRSDTDQPLASRLCDSRDAIHLLFAAEKVRETYPLPTADVTESVPADDYTIVTLEALVRMKLNSFRRKDQIHLLDMLSLGLIDASWLPRLVPEHAARLQQLIDDPDG